MSFESEDSIVFWIYVASFKNWFCFHRLRDSTASRLLYVHQSLHLPYVFATPEVTPEYDDQNMWLSFPELIAEEPLPAITISLEVRRVSPIPRVW